MESQNFGHEHPLVFNEEHSDQNEAAHCSRCGDEMSCPSFSCAECEFHLHKECAEAPSQINHPFHRNHPLNLLPNSPAEDQGDFTCNFCGEIGEMFLYHCSCDLNFHVNCALFTYNIAEKTLGEIEHIACKDPSTSPESGDEELENAECFGCWELLLDSDYYSFSCGFNLHKKCAELAFEINYPCHRKHPLVLQFNSENFPCMICQETNQTGFFYCCSPCGFAIHVRCLSTPSMIEDKGHPHPYTLFLRQVSFTCDACGVEGNCVPYMCSTCNLLVHKNCISLPRIIRFTWHEHPIRHTYFLQGDESKNWDCVICRDEVNTEHGSYYCSDCHFIVHANCIIEIEEWYTIIDPEEKLDDFLSLLPNVPKDSFIVIERNESGETTKIQHFSHVHNLMSSDKLIVEGDKYCDGCTLSISDSFYYCVQCNFFLHKICAELPRKRHAWFNMCQQPVVLFSDYIFRCTFCHYDCNGFAYNCDVCGDYTCLRCMIPDVFTCKGHEHRLSFYLTYEGQCKACGEDLDQAYNCKECNFCLDYNCLLLPLMVRHKCDDHLLTLTYHDDNTYVECHFCDICEEYRNPDHWYYYCAICDTSAHPKCALGSYSFMKLGKTYQVQSHPHPLTFVKKISCYPECSICGKPCEDLALECEKCNEPRQDLALECGKPGRKYIVHWKCIRPPRIPGEI